MVAACSTTRKRRISATYRLEFKFPFIWISGVLLVRVMPPQTITLPPPKAVTGCTLHSACCSPLRRQTRLLPSICRRQARISSVNKTFFHCCLFHRECALAHCKRASRCRIIKMDFLTKRLAKRPTLCKRFLMVCTLTLCWFAARSPVWISGPANE